MTTRETGVCAGTGAGRMACQGHGRDRFLAHFSTAECSTFKRPQPPRFYALLVYSPPCTQGFREVEVPA
jgi:hypothetical protein